MKLKEPMRFSRLSRPLVLAAPVLAALVALLPVSAGAQMRPGGPVTVGVMVLETATVPVSTTLPGRAVSANAALIRPRVGGIITQILFTPGARVEAGAPLVQLDPLQYEAALVTAQARLARARAALPVAETAFDRARALAATAATSQSALQSAEAEALKARADVAEAEADLHLAQAQLSWTTITAPVAGVIGVPLAAVGDVVTANQAAALAEVVQLDPIHVDVTEPVVSAMRLAEQVARGEVTRRAPELWLTLENGQPHDTPGQLISPTATVSPTTGTRMLRFSVANPDGTILPGMFLRGDLALGDTSAVLVPQRATERAPDGSLTAYFVEEGRARKRVLVEAGTHDNAWILRSGAVPGDVLVVDGLNTLRDGAEVTTVPVAIDALGVVRDTAPADPARKVN